MSIKIQGICPYLQVFDMPTSVKFYKVLGFEIFQQSSSGENFDWGWLKRGEMELMLNTIYESQNRPPVPDPARTSAHGDTVLFFGCNDLDALYNYLRAHGIDAKPPSVAPYGMNQLWLKDPDGYGICFQHRV